MAHTKHKSASVLQGYVDNSMTHKINVSSALAVTKKAFLRFWEWRRYYYNYNKLCYFFMIQSLVPNKQVKVCVSPDSVSNGKLIYFFTLLI